MAPSQIGMPGMRDRARGCVLWLFGLVLLCTGPATAQTALFSPYRPATKHAAPTQPVGLAMTVRAGLENIANLYLHASKIPDLVVAGLRGLSRLDSRLSARLNADRVDVLLDQVVIASYPSPSPDNITAWSRLVARAIEETDDISSIVHNNDRQTIIKAFFDAALGILDPYSSYVQPGTARDNRAQREGFGGVGIRIASEARGARIRQVFQGGPADRVGLQWDDLILRADGKSVAGLTDREITDLLRGRVNSFLRIVVEREQTDRTITLDMVREWVVMPTAFLRWHGDVAVIRIVGFNYATAKQVNGMMKKSVARQDSSRLRGFILDMRGNPGGLLDQAVAVADHFLASGLIISAEGRHPDSHQYYYADRIDLAHDLPIVVLLDHQSASAAEIVAAALQENGRAVVVGTRSFGKGTVQTVIDMPNHGELILTWALLNGPSGNSFNGIGIAPAICTTLHYSDAGSAVRAVLARSDRRNERLHCPPPRAHTSSAALQIGRELIERPDLYRSAQLVARRLAPMRKRVRVGDRDRARAASGEKRASSPRTETP